MKRLVTISREYGSGGRIIGRLLAEKLNVPFYDKETIDAGIEEQGYSREMIDSAELRAKNSFSYSLSSALSRSGGNTAENLSVNERIFIANYNVIRDICKSGQGVIVGRCADYILEDVPGVTNVFIYGELEDRVKRAIEKYGDDPENASRIVADYDKSRQHYYNYHTGKKWGDYKNYNLSINSSYITEEEAAELIVTYVEKRSY